MGDVQKLMALATIGLMTMALMGCAHTISESIRQQADISMPYEELWKAPQRFKNRTVILGGDIFQTYNVKDGTLIEVIEKPLNRYEKPRVSDVTRGRFMARCEQYLDPAIYRKGRPITVAGRVLGEHIGKVGEAEYVYPLICCLEFHLWPEPEPTFRYAPYPWWYWEPWYWRPYYPYWR